MQLSATQVARFRDCVKRCERYLRNDRAALLRLRHRAAADALQRAFRERFGFYKAYWHARRERAKQLDSKNDRVGANRVLQREDAEFFRGLRGAEYETVAAAAAAKPGQYYIDNIRSAVEK